MTTTGSDTQARCPRFAWAQGKTAWTTVLGVMLHLAAAQTASAIEPVSAIAMHGTAKFAESFPHYDSVAPDAPKGGRLAQGVFGSFDSVNPFIIKGVPASGVANNRSEERRVGKECLWYV